MWGATTCKCPEAGPLLCSLVARVQNIAVIFDVVCVSVWRLLAEDGGTRIVDPGSWNQDRGTTLTLSHLPIVSIGVELSEHSDSSDSAHTIHAA